MHQKFGPYMAFNKEPGMNREKEDSGNLNPILSELVEKSGALTAMLV